MKKGDAKASSPGHVLTHWEQPGSLAAVLELSFDAAAAFDVRERITYWNPAAEQLYGWTAQEALGKTPAKLFWPLSTPEEKKTRRERQARLKRGEVVRGKHQACRRDGSRIAIEYAIRPAFDSQGSFTGSLAFYRDISLQTLPERRRAEQQLKESDEKFRNIFDQSPVGIGVYNAEGELVNLNRASMQMFGISSSEQVMGLQLFSSPTVQAAVREKLRHHEQIREEVVYDFDEIKRLGFYETTKSGVAYFDRIITPLRSSSTDAPFGYMSQVLDITERKRVEAELERSNQKLNEILTSIHDDFYVLDRDWIFIYANRQFTSKVGKEPKDFVGNNIWELFPKHLGTVFEENLRAAMEKREIRRFEIPGKYTDAWYSMTVFPSREGITVLGTDITKRKRAEDALRESEERLRQMIETSPVAIGFGDSTGKILAANLAFYRLTGYTREEIEGQHIGWNQLTAPEYAEIDRQTMPTLEATGSAGPYEKEYIRKDGSRVPLLLTVAKLPGRDEHIAFIMDITERKRAEDALRESQRKYQDLIETTSDFIWETDAQGHYTYCSPQMESLWGMNPESMLGKTPFDVMPAEQREQGLQHFRQVASAALPFKGLTAAALDGNGEPITIETSGVPFFDHNGRLLGYRGITRDITERKRAEDALGQAMQELQMHIDNSPLAVISFDPDYRITEWSAGAERIFGWQAGEVLNKSISELHWVHEDDVQRVSDLSADMLAGRTPSNTHANRNYRKDGSVIECEWYNSALLDARGQLISVRSQVLDVTERKRAEETVQEHQRQLQLLNETLEQKVREKTAEVHRLASDVIKAVQQERYRISHILHDDLQQRIYAIQMQLTFLHDGLQQEDETLRLEVAGIEKQLADILSVTRHLSIDLSPPILRDEGLAHAINWLAAQMRQRYGLPIELRAEGPFAIRDEELHVLLFNCVRELLFNVVKHARASRAVVGLHWVEDGLKIEVTDDGQGFPVHAPEKPGNGETGDESLQASSGLPTIRHQLSLFGGRMEIQSEPGAGTQVILVVPLVQAG